MTVQNLDNVKPIVEVSNGTVPDYTFDATKGTVTFSSAPVKGNNNVIITAYKTNDEYLNTVINCKYFKPYGGNSNSRLFVAGGGDGGGGDFHHCAEDQQNLPEGSGLDWQIKLLCRCR